MQRNVKGRDKNAKKMKGMDVFYNKHKSQGQFVPITHRNLYLSPHQQLKAQFQK